MRVICRYSIDQGCGTCFLLREALVRVVPEWPVKNRSNQKYQYSVDFHERSASFSFDKRPTHFGVFLEMISPKGGYRYLIVKLAHQTIFLLMAS